MKYDNSFIQLVQFVWLIALNRALSAFLHVEMMLCVLKPAPDRVLENKGLYEVHIMNSDIEKYDFKNI